MRTDNIVTNHLVEISPSMADIEATKIQLGEQNPSKELTESERTGNPDADATMPMAIWNGS